MSKRINALLLIAVILVMTLCVGCNSTPQSTETAGASSEQKNDVSSPTNSSEDKQTMYARLSKSVVFINVYDDSDEIVATASGFLINDGKTLVTCDHVIEGAYYIEAIYENGDSTLCKEVIAHDSERDLAILSCEESINATPLILSDSSAVVQGDAVFVIGSPLGLQNTISEGIVSALRIDGETNIIQMTAAISSGSSGGAVFNDKGEVIGIVSASFTRGQNLNLAVCSNEVVELLENNA